MPPVLFFDKFLVSTNHQISINAHIGAPRTRGVPRVDKEIFWSWWSWLHWLRCWKCSKFNSLRNHFTTPRLLRNFQSIQTELPITVLADRWKDKSLTRIHEWRNAIIAIVATALASARLRIGIAAERRQPRLRLRTKIRHHESWYIWFFLFILFPWVRMSEDHKKLKDIFSRL